MADVTITAVQRRCTTCGHDVFAGESCFVAPVGSGSAAGTAVVSCNRCQTCDCAACDERRPLSSRPIARRVPSVPSLPRSVAGPETRQQAREQGRADVVEFLDRIGETDWAHAIRVEFGLPVKT